MRARSLRFAPVIAAAVAALVVLSGCSAATPTASTTPAASSSVDTMFGKVDVPAASSTLKVVALGWSDAEMALALGVKPIAVYDWQGFGAENKGVGSWATSLFGDVTPEIIQRGTDSLNYESIEVLDPDLILNVRSGNDEKEFERLSQIAPTVYAPTGTGAYAISWDAQMTSVAAALGMQDKGADIIKDVDAKITAAKDANPEFAGLTTAAATKFGDAYGAYLPGDGRFDILADLGFVNYPAITKLKASGFYADVSAENVSAFDADVMVMIPIGYTSAEVAADPLLKSLSVVKDDRSVFIDPTTELSGAYSAASVLSIPVVLDQLVPELKAAAAKVAK